MTLPKPNASDLTTAVLVVVSIAATLSGDAGQAYVHAVIAGPPEAKVSAIAGVVSAAYAIYHARQTEPTIVDRRSPDGAAAPIAETIAQPTPPNREPPKGLI